MSVGSAERGTITTRPARPSDAALIVRYVRALAAFEKEPPENVLLDETVVLRDAFSEHPRFEVIIAESSGAPIGMALFFQNYSTWTARSGLWIEELFVEQERRGRGAGATLLAAVASIADERGCGRVELAALRWNPATEFYSRCGFEPLEEWQTYRLDADGIRQLAHRAPGTDATQSRPRSS